ncbi:hypothetical protein A2U01_0078887, partial [Trifolium medium]|nr:hypothetical protein [Trifolium medium]
MTKMNSLSFWENCYEEILLVNV